LEHYHLSPQQSHRRLFDLFFSISDSADFDNFLPVVKVDGIFNLIDTVANSRWSITQTFLKINVDDDNKDDWDDLKADVIAKSAFAYGLKRTRDLYDPFVIIYLNCVLSLIPSISGSLLPSLRLMCIIVALKPNFPNKTSMTEPRGKLINFEKRTSPIWLITPMQSTIPVWKSRDRTQSINWPMARICKVRVECEELQTSQQHLLESKASFEQSHDVHQSLQHRSSIKENQNKRKKTCWLFLLSCWKKEAHNADKILQNNHHHPVFHVGMRVPYYKFINSCGSCDYSFNLTDESMGVLST